MFLRGLLPGLMLASLLASATAVAAPAAGLKCKAHYDQGVKERVVLAQFVRVMGAESVAFYDLDEPVIIERHGKKMTLFFNVKKDAAITLLDPPYFIIDTDLCGTKALRTGTLAPYLIDVPARMTPVPSSSLP